MTIDHLTEFNDIQVFILVIRTRLLLNGVFNKATITDDVKAIEA